MRKILTLIMLIWAGQAAAETTPGFHAGVHDCLDSIADLDHPFPLANEVEGSAENGFVAWYHDADGQPIYAVRLGVSGMGAEQVISCQGPAPMGPSMDEFLESDVALLTTYAGERDLILLEIPAEGMYFANCNAPTPDLLIAITFDETNRTAVQVVKSAGVVQTCERFGP